MYFDRCTARPPDLDSGGTARKERHTEEVVKNLTVGDAWTDYGIVADIVVSYAELLRVSFVPFSSFCISAALSYSVSTHPHPLFSYHII